MRSLLSDCRTVSRYKRKCNFIDAYKKSTAFPEPVLTKLMNSHQHYAQITYTELRRNGTINAYRAERHSLTSPSDVWLSQHRFFTKLAHHSTNVLWTSRVTNFFQVGRKIQKIWAQLQWSTAYCEPIFMKITTAFNGIVWRSPTLHRISSKSAETNERCR